MRWREALHPVGMQRVAVLAPSTALRDLLVAVGDQGTLDPDEPTHGDTPARPGPSAQRLQRLAQPPADAALSATPPDLDECERRGRLDLIAGEAQLEARNEQALVHGELAALVGWMPIEEVPRLAARIEPLGGAVAPLPAPRGVQPPTLLPRTGTSHAFDPLVTTYATVPYADVNPSVLAGVTYVTMFGIMFADAGHGSLLVLAALAVRFGWWCAARAAAPGVAVPRRRRGREHRLRGAVRRVLRSHRRDPGRLDGAPRQPGPAAARRRRGRRGAARGVVRPGLGEPVPRGRLAQRRAGAVRAGRGVDVHRARPPRRRPVRRTRVAHRVRGGRDGAGPAGPLRRPAGRRGRGRGRRCRSGGRAVRHRRPARLQRRQLRAPRGVRPDPRRPRRGRLAGHHGAVGPRRRRRCRRGAGVRARQRAGLHARGRGGRDPGPPPGVLRALLPHLRHRGAALPSLARSPVPTGGLRHDLAPRPARRPPGRHRHHGPAPPRPGHRRRGAHRRRCAAARLPGRPAGGPGHRAVRGRHDHRGRGRRHDERLGPDRRGHRRGRLLASAPPSRSPTPGPPPWPR